MLLMLFLFDVDVVSLPVVDVVSLCIESLRYPKCISGTDQLRQICVLPHRQRSCGKKLTIAQCTDLRPTSSAAPVTPGAKQGRRYCGRLVGPVVKVSASRAADPEFDSRLRRGDFSGSSHTSDFELGSPVATLPGAWRYRVSAGTGWPGVSIR